MGEAFERFSVAGTEVQVAFPDAGNAAGHIRNILRGLDYPLLGHGYEPERVIDIGANVGATALYFANAYPWVDLYCYEPSPSTFEYLQRNMRAAPNARAFNFGLADADAEVKLYLGRSQCLQHSTVASIEVRDDYEIVSLKRASVALRQVITEGTVLKVDTEGCELQILQDLQPMFGSVDVMYVEYHSEADRRRIDRLLEPDFDLWSASAHTLHRGNVAYVAHRVIASIPALGQWEIRR